MSRYVVLADWLFTATTAVFQPASGFWLMHMAGGMPISFLAMFYMMVTKRVPTPM